MPCDAGFDVTSIPRIRAHLDAHARARRNRPDLDLAVADLHVDHAAGVAHLASAVLGAELPDDDLLAKGAAIASSSAKMSVKRSQRPSATRGRRRRWSRSSRLGRPSHSMRTLSSGGNEPEGAVRPTRSGCSPASPPSTGPRTRCDRSRSACRCRRCRSFASVRQLGPVHAVDAHALVVPVLLVVAELIVDRSDVRVADRALRDGRAHRGVHRGDLPDRDGPRRRRAARAGRHLDRETARWSRRRRSTSSRGCRWSDRRLAVHGGRRPRSAGRPS